jgi:hypothetical protein
VAEAKCKTFSGCLVLLHHITEDRVNLKTAVAQRITAINVIAGVSVGSGVSSFPRVYALTGFLDCDQAGVQIRKCGLERCPCVKYEVDSFEILLGLLPSFGCGHRLSCGSVPNVERSHAGPTTPGCNEGAQPALAAAAR